MRKLIVLFLALGPPALAYGQATHVPRANVEDKPAVDGQSLTVIGCRRDDAPSADCDDGDICLPVCTSTGALLTNAGAAGAVADTELPAAALLADDTATPTAPAAGCFLQGYDGATWDFVRATAADGVLVNLGANSDVDTELGAAALMADDAATPTAGIVAAYGVYYDGATWDFVRGTAADGQLVNLGGNNDVTATMDVSTPGTTNSVAPITGQDGVAAGAGAVGVTTQRMTLASDDPAVTALEIVDDWDEANRAAVNLIAGQVAVAGGSGVNGATVQRVTVATDDTVATDLTAIKTAAEIVDDWDEADRAAVNLISGQVGIAGGTGVDGATVPRVTLATDVGLPAGISNVGDVDVEIIGTAATYGTAGSLVVADATVVAAVANTRTYGCTIIEDAAAPAAASGVLRHDTVAATCDGDAIMPVTLAASGIVQLNFGGTRGMATPSGVCWDFVSGSVSINCWTSVEAAP